MCDARGLTCAILGGCVPTGQRSLLDNLAGSSGKADEGAKAGAGAAGEGAGPDADDDVDVPPEIEDIVEMLLTGLRDKVCSCYVRSAHVVSPD